MLWNRRDGEILPRKGKLFILSGPSGAGKGTVLKKLLAEFQGLRFSVSATTRPPRLGEEGGADYLFISHTEFERLIQEDALLEWAKVHGHYYGTPRKAVLDLLLAGENVILDIDTQGAQQLKEKGLAAVFIFLAPPSQEELKRRLVARGTEDRESLHVRLKNAAIEMQRRDQYDYLVLNEDVDAAVCRLKAILIAEECRILQDQEECGSWSTR